MRRVPEFIVTLVVALCVAASIILLGRDSVYREAVSHGVAEWTVEPTTGITKFRWKEPVP